MLPAKAVIATANSRKLSGIYFFIELWYNKYMVISNTSKLVAIFTPYEEIDALVIDTLSQ